MQIRPAALFLLPALATAQIPAPSVLVSTQVTTANTGLVSVDVNGRATTLTGHGRVRHNAIALDRNDPAGVWSMGGWATTGSAPVGHYLLKGYDASTKGPGDGQVGTFGAVARCHVHGDDLLIAFTSVTPGLYRRPLTGGGAVLIAAINDAFDICVRRGKAYVTTWTPSASASQLYEVDLTVTPAKVRLVPIVPTSGSAPKLFKACCSYGWEESALYVALGSSDGKLWFVDPDQSTGNAFSVTFGASRGMAEALMTHPDQGIGMVVATTTGLYSLPSYNTGGQPFYTAANPILDVTVLGGGSQTYGQGCRGAQGEPLHDHGLNGWPYNGNARFSIALGNGPPSTPGALVVGFSRAAIDLSILGAPQCFLNLQIALQLPVQTDVNGRVVVPAPIPVDARLIGSKVLLQWGIFERGANPAGLITTRGLERIVR